MQNDKLHTNDKLYANDKSHIDGELHVNDKSHTNGRFLRFIRKFWLTIILVIAVSITGYMALQNQTSNKKITYSEHLNETAVIVNDTKITLREMAFYVAYEEANVEEQAEVYDSDAPWKYWNIHTNGEFVRVAAKERAMSMAIHDEIFYEMAVEDEIELTDDERKLLENDEQDFWSDLTDIDGANKMGVAQEDIFASMEKIALAQKYQDIYAQLHDADTKDYDYTEDAYKKLLEKNTYKSKSVWESVPMGHVTLNY